MIHINEALRPENVHTNLKATDINSAIKELLAGFSEDSRVTNLEAFTEEVLLREAAAPTAFGNGLAIPHARSSNANTLFLAAGVPTAGIRHPNGEMVHFVILAGIPLTMASEYLRILGCLARVFTTPGSSAWLLKATNPSAFVATLEQLSQKL